MTKTMDLNELLESETAERIVGRLNGELSEAEQQVWGGDFAASGDMKPLPPPPET